MSFTSAGANCEETSSSKIYLVDCGTTILFETTYTNQVALAFNTWLFMIVDLFFYRIGSSSSYVSHLREDKPTEFE